ncbi:hypothetical protein PRIPAC_74948 [Pristionchus pacificus]|nr:hypothetical protein PRIPAC_74948 [Pristionchus pacificus]|eukprot:PDM73916.1 hypothetical protein PRIPAC_41272 [Pristionchus pacificus]
MSESRWKLCISSRVSGHSSDTRRAMSSARRERPEWSTACEITREIGTETNGYALQPLIPKYSTFRSVGPSFTFPLFSSPGTWKQETKPDLYRKERGECKAQIGEVELIVDVEEGEHDSAAEGNVHEEHGDGRLERKKKKVIYLMAIAFHNDL